MLFIGATLTIVGFLILPAPSLQQGERVPRIYNLMNHDFAKHYTGHVLVVSAGAAACCEK